MWNRHDVIMSWLKNVPRRILQFTTDPAVRVGILEAAYSVAPAYSRGLLPRTPGQQAVVVGVSAASYYAIGATTWAGVSSVYAGVPGHRAGPRALLVGAAVTGGVGFLGERLLRPRSGDGLFLATTWSMSRFLSTVGLAGGIVTTSDLIAHQYLGRRPSLGTTLALDIAGGALMGAGTFLRRDRRIRKYGLVDGDRPAVSQSKSVKSYPKIVGLAAGTAAGITTLAIAEQTAARAIATGLSEATDTELGEAGVLLSHLATAGVLSLAAASALNIVRRRTQRRSDVKEAAYPSAPMSPHVSCGPNSAVDFDKIGKEGRRFVLMALTDDQIERVMDEPAVDPVRIVVPRQGSIAKRAELAVAELDALGGFDRSIIMVASPTGVGYVNYIMAEALEYLARGDCATVVPQYALVPSALALDTTTQGTELQGQILQAISDRIRSMPQARRPRLVQFGESLGAQVALDVASEGGVHRMDSLGVEAGLYLGVPFRSSAWRSWWRNPRTIDPDGRMVLVTQANDAPKRPGLHLMVVHNDDPVNKFSYTMFVRRPWWFGEPEDRPPLVPRESLFRPVISFVIALADLLNGMNMAPGEFKRVGHDYRIDIREATEKAFLLRSSPEQAQRIEAELRAREQAWAQTRLVAKTAAKAMATINRKMKSWGQDSQDMDLADREDINLPPTVRKFLTSMKLSSEPS